ncbi:MAG: 50S ribosomal protein L4 [Vulcanimicrobiaceae bacterium]
MATLTPAKAPKALLDATLANKRHTIFRAVFRELANPRAGTASTKKRDEVRGGGRKPWRQKGTGRARQGSIRSPQWRHGGVVFGPQPRSYETDLNKKERRLALAAALADRFTADAVSIVDVKALGTEKTKDLAASLFGSAKASRTAARTLLVFESNERELGVRVLRAGRNLQRLGITHTAALDVKDVIGHARLIFTQAAYDKLCTALGGTE